jgi:predicted enzyme related to lactoylglutathione lyase
MPRVIHFELPVDDPERAVEFYTKAFGWQISKWEGPQDYWLVQTGEPGEPGIDGAIMRRSDLVGGTVNTLDVASLDAAVDKVTANGGSLVGEKLPIPGVGYFAYCRDTEGNLFGMMEAERRAS